MKKGIIVAITVAICAVLAATYAFAAPTKGKEKKGEETTVESTTTEKKEATKDQEPSEEDCEYEDNGENDAEVIE